jgi:hypothetical protein
VVVVIAATGEVFMPIIPFVDYITSDLDKTSIPGTLFVGKTNRAGNWIIIRMVNKSQLTFAVGISGYSTAWTGRTGLTYKEFSDL